MATLTDILQQLYGARCRVIEDQGDYARIIRVRYGPKDSIQVQVAISKNTEEHNVDVFVRGGETSMNKELQEFIKLQNPSNDQNELLALFRNIDDWFSTRLGSEEEESKSTVVSKSSKPKKKHKNKNDRQSPDEDENKKQASMKTAEDVIKRLRWDESLPASHFTVGYLDRFIGVIEKPFSAFNWEDLVNAELTDLAIPQHRVQYFRYRTTKVWDKTEKLDLIFNSLQASPTIYQVMKSEDEKCGEVVENNETVGEEVQAAIESNAVQVDDQQVAQTSGEHSSDAVDVPEGVRPDYFLAIPIDNQVIKNRVALVQESFSSQYPKVVKTLVKPDHLHVTVALFCKKDIPGGIVDVVSALRNEKDALTQLAQEVKFSGLALLADRVLCSCPSELFKSTVSAKLKEIFDKYNIKYYSSTVPHLTIGKLNLAKDPESVEPIRNILSVSRFNGIQMLTKLVLRPVGMHIDAETVFDLTSN